MQHHPAQTAPQAKQTTPSTPKPGYQKPAVQDLGSWQTVTLVFSVPIGPGGPGNSGTSQRF